MTSPYSFSVLISQMPRVQKIQGDFQAFAEMTQGHLAREVIAKQEREQQQVPRTESSDETAQVKSDQQGGRGSSQGRSSRGQGRGTDEEEQMPSSPDSGRLLDIEV